MSVVELTNIDSILDLIKDFRKAKESFATLGAKHTVIQGSIDDLNRHLDSSAPHIAAVMKVLDAESEALLGKISEADVEFKRLDSLLDKKHVELRLSLRTGLDVLCEIGVIRQKPKPDSDAVDLSSINDLVDATQTKCAYHEFRPLPSIGSNDVCLDSSDQTKTATILSVLLNDCNPRV